MQISPVWHHITSHNELSEKYSFLDEYVSIKTCIYKKLYKIRIYKIYKNLKIALLYVLISWLVINPLYLFVNIFYQGKILRFQNVIMRCDVTPVTIFAYETKLNILQRKQVTKIL